MLVFWEVLARSGLLYRDVVPSLFAIGAALVKLLSTPTSTGTSGSRRARSAPRSASAACPASSSGSCSAAAACSPKAYEPYLYYLGPTPKIIFFPVMIMWFGVGPGSKVAMGAISCFFPIALSTAAGMRQIDKVLIRVGKSFRANAWQMATKIYLPAMRHPMINGVRLGLGVAIIGTLLAETKLSNRGVGFLIIQAYSLFDMPRMYAMLIVLFVVAIGANALVGRLGGLSSIRQR